MSETIRSFLEPPISAAPTHAAAKLVWIVRLRWIAVAAQLLAVAPALELRLLEPRLLPPFLGITASLVILNAGTRVYLLRGGRVQPGLVLLQLSADVAALTGLLGITGGAWNPLAPILFVHVALGALLLEGGLGLFFFGLLLACLGLIQLRPHIPPGLEEALLPPRVLIPAQLAIAVAFWLLTVSLSRTLIALQNSFALLSERKTRVDRLRAVGALAAGTCHEFATPLNTAQLRLTRLARNRNIASDPDLELANEALERCGDILRRMAGSQLRPEALELEAVDVDTLVESVCASVTGAAQEALADVHFERQDQMPRRALLPQFAFSHALLNLIENAQETTPAQEHVDVEVRSRGDRIDVCVHDRGAGWPEVVREHLGEPFVTTKPEGGGLGLYYVHSFVEAVGAELVLEDRRGGGATARVSLPALTTREAVG
ncbi:MAG: HAMP domain-containing histidine kinase [Deltaproteobacteria bacterium]|nr:HAMP domain-containing histidine kinase [Deltaproteobacteria bacterium]MBW2418810.1 HAMP domain-containing histidine kinase [Deltaproteobacteria bacterium]